MVSELLMVGRLFASMTLALFLLSRPVFPSFKEDLRTRGEQRPSRILTEKNGFTSAEGRARLTGTALAFLVSYFRGSREVRRDSSTYSSFCDDRGRGVSIYIYLIMKAVVLLFAQHQRHSS